MTEQVPTEQRATPRTDAAAKQPRVLADEVVSADFARQLERELTEAMRSLRREENARKVLADENTRLTKKNAELYQHVTDLIEECQSTQRQLAAWVNQS